VISRTVEGYLFEEFIYCGCNCGRTRPPTDEYKRPAKFIHGHHRKGKKLSKERIERFIGINNPSWKGENVGYHGIHKWARRHLPKPDLCPICKLISPKDIANLSGKYKRDLSDWQWMCKKCHIRYDFLNYRNLRKYIERNRKYLPKTVRIFINNFFAEC
jgi:hypothetical protein